MADAKLTALTELSAAADEDYLYIVDASNTTDDPAGSSRKITVAGVRANLIPAGTLRAYAGSSYFGSGWLVCDGTAYSRTTYADLFAVVGTDWGAGDGTTTFNVPNFRRRVLVGSGGTGSGTLANTVGSTGGSETHTLTTTETPSHTHSLPSASATLGTGTTGYSSIGTTNSISGFSTTSGSTGSGGSHNNLQPSAVVLYLIKI